VRRADVARLAGTSPAVVSYVLNDGPRPVAPATRARVLAAVEQLGYRRNGVARALRTQRTMTLGLVVPDIVNPFFAEVARAVEDAAFGRGYTMIVGNASEDLARQDAYVRTFLERQVDGLLLVPAHGRMDWLPELARSQRPWVVLDRRVPDLTGVSQVLVDNVGGAAAATEHLVEHGRTRIACIAGPNDVLASTERVAGWRRALEASGGSPAAMPLRHVPFGRHAGYEAVREILATADVDALFVASDEQALGVLRAINDSGRRCPDDVALVSFDGIAASAHATPGLTTMAQPFSELATAALRELLDRVSDPETEAVTSVLPVTLVRRGSCGCPDTAPA
jgi:LacI family transcriptional regulator